MGSFCQTEEVSILFLTERSENNKANEKGIEKAVGRCYNESAWMITDAF